MKLYPKKLRSIEDLEQERKLLLKESQQLDKEEIFSMKGVLDGIGGGKKKDKGDVGFSLLDYLPISSPVVLQVAKMVMSRLSKKKESKQKTYYEAELPFEKEKREGPGMLKKVAMELIGGYLKWKAVELSYKGMRHLVKKRQASRAAASASENK